MNPCEVLIVGAGPAGVSTWLHLAQHAPELARRAVVVDRAVFPRDKLCGGGLGGWSGAVLDRLGIALDIPSLEINDVRFLFDDGVYDVHRPGFFRMVERLKFDHHMVQIACRRGMVFSPGEALVDFRRHRGRVTVRTSRRQYCVKVLVGADGALSRVRRHLRLKEWSHLSATLEVFTPAAQGRRPAHHRRRIYLDFRPLTSGLQGYLWHIPTLCQGTESVAHGVCDFRIHRRRPRLNLKTILAASLNRRGVLPGKTGWRSHPIRWLAPGDVIARPHILLIGDAAGIEPAFGGGIHLALSYGEVAAGEIVAAYQKDDFSFAGYAERLFDHPVGQYIRRYGQEAIDLYGGKVMPEKVVGRLMPPHRAPADLMTMIFNMAGG